jgi:hypothetical protein
MAVAALALALTLTGSAWAAFGDGAFRRNSRPAKHSVGARQLKAKSVRTGKIANSAVTGSKVAAGTLTGADIKLAQLGTVPNAREAGSAGTAGTLDGHSARCPAGTTLIRGTCFDLSLSGPVSGVKAAANVCAARSGFLPSPMELYSIRNVINLGTGVAPDYAFSDAYYANTVGVNYRTVAVDGAGKTEEIPVESNAKFVCTYELVR